MKRQTSREWNAIIKDGKNLGIEADNNLLSSKEAGKELNVNASRVRQLYMAGRLPGLKVGKVLVFKRSDLDLVRDRPLGNPQHRIKKNIEKKKKKA